MALLKQKLNAAQTLETWGFGRETSCAISTKLQIPQVPVKGKLQLGKQRNQTLDSLLLSCEGISGFSQHGFLSFFGLGQSPLLSRTIEGETAEACHCRGWENTAVSWEACCPTIQDSVGYLILLLHPSLPPLAMLLVPDQLSSAGCLPLLLCQDLGGNQIFSV